MTNEAIVNVFNKLQSTIVEFDIIDLEYLRMSFVDYSNLEIIINRDDLDWIIYYGFAYHDPCKISRVAFTNHTSYLKKAELRYMNEGVTVFSGSVGFASMPNAVKNPSRRLYISFLDFTIRCNVINTQALFYLKLRL